MKNRHLQGALLFAVASLLATGAYADPPHAATPGKANAADKGGDDKGKSSDDKGKAADDRAARITKEHDAQRQKLQSILKGPVDDAVKQELRRHAERLARLERIKAVAQTEKDTAAVEKTRTLIAKENERDDKWMSKRAAVTTAAAAPGATPTPVAPGATPTLTADSKGGAK